MKIKILGVCGSPIKGGNTEVFLAEALKVAGEIEDVETELVQLANKDIKDCVHCNWCMRKQEEGKFCAQKDDMSEIFPKLVEADGLLLATPVYIGRLSGRLANFTDRFRVFVFGNVYRDRMKDKVGGALAVSWARHGGMETALLSVNYAFCAMGMITCHEHGGILYGATGVSSLGGTGKFDPDDKLQVLKDEYGLKSARRLAKRMVELIRIIKAGKEALKV